MSLLRAIIERQYADRPLTIADVLDGVRELGLTCGYKRIGASWEFRVNYSPYEGGTEKTAYYTSDREDAMNMAHAMRKAKPRD